MKKTVVIGASPDEGRYSNMAVRLLKEHGHKVIPIGTRHGEIAGLAIENGQPEIIGTHTVTLYINANRQPELYTYILGLNPQRIIFNPGTENSEFEKLASEHGIETMEACTLVMLRTGQF